MKSRNSRALVGALALAGAALAPGAAQAQTAADKWQWELAMYGWFPAIGGSTQFPTGASGPSFDVSASDVIDSLKMAFMGQVEARKDKWGVWSDLVYSDLGGEKSGSHDFSVGGHPVSASANLSLDVKTTFWTVAGLYNLTTKPENTTDVIFGARLIDMNQTLNYTLSAPIPELPTANGKISASANNWDAIVGLKGRVYFGADRRWFLPYYVDVGGGQSKLTWQINGGIGYKFDWGAVVASWRYLDYEFKSGQALQGMNMSGALLGVAFQF